VWLDQKKLAWNMALHIRMAQSMKAKRVVMVVCMVIFP